MHFIKFKVQISTFKVLEVLDGSIHLPAVFLLLQGLSLVILLLTLAEGDVHLSPALVVDEYEGWHDGEARLLAVVLQSAQLALGEEQLAVAASLVVAKRTIEIRRYVHALHPELPLVEVAVAVHERSLAPSDRLNLGAREHDACGVGVNEEVLE